MALLVLCVGVGLGKQAARFFASLMDEYNFLM